MLNLFKSRDGSVELVSGDSTGETVSDEEMFACEVCDGLVKESDSECPHCGALFEEEYEEESIPSGPTRGPPGGGPPGGPSRGPPGEDHLVQREDHLVVDHQEGRQVQRKDRRAVDHQEGHQVKERTAKWRTIRRTTKRRAVWTQERSTRRWTRGAKRGPPGGPKRGPPR